MLYDDCDVLEDMKISEEEKNKELTPKEGEKGFMIKISRSEEKNLSLQEFCTKLAISRAFDAPIKTS